MNNENKDQPPIGQLFLDYLNEAQKSKKGMKPMKDKKKTQGKVSVPKNTVLHLLREGLVSGDITRREVEKAIVEAIGPDNKVDKDFHEKAKALTESMGISGDGLKFSIKSPKAGKFKLYLLKHDNRVASDGIAEIFDGLDDMDRAASVVLDRYLQSICSNE